MEFLVPPPGGRIPLSIPSHVYTRKEISQGSANLFCEFLVQLMEKDPEGRYRYPNFCTPQRFRLSHLPMSSLLVAFFFFFTSI